MTKKNKGLKKLIGSLAVAIVIVAAVFVFMWSGLPYKYFLKVDKVTGVDARACYSEVDITWEPVKHAKGYSVYEEIDGQIQPVGVVTGECRMIIDDYDREKHHKYMVAGWGYDPGKIEGEEGEGPLSDPVEVFYDKERYAQKIPVLAYHDLIPGGMEPESTNSMPQDKFDEQMKYLEDNGFRTLTMDEFRSWHEGKREFPVKSCVITFDDGYYGVYHLGYPVIRKHGLAATAFLIGHHIEDTTDEYDPKSEEGHYIGMDVISRTREEYPRFEFESHTYDMHKRINGRKPVNVLSYDEMVRDCKKNREFGFRYMAYPWGKHNADMRKALKDTGYKVAFAYRPFYYATRDNDPYAVDRIKISSKDSMDEFIKTVNGEVEDYDR